MATAIADTRHLLPPKVQAGHVPDLVLPPPYIVRQYLGQLVDVRDAAGNRYLVADGGTHWLLHRRVTPNAKGHERNLTEAGPPVGIEKPAAA